MRTQFHHVIDIVPTIYGAVGVRAPTKVDGLAQKQVAGVSTLYLAASGGEFGGWSLYLKDGKLFSAHNYLKLHEYAVASAKPVPAGKHQLSVQFHPTGASKQPAFFTGDTVLSVDGQTVGELKDIKVAGQYSAVTGSGLQIGRNTVTPVSHCCEVPFAFAGKLEKVAIDVQSTTKKTIDAPAKDRHVDFD